MNDPVAMGMIDGVADLTCKIQRARHIERALSSDDRFQGLARDILHHDEKHVLMLLSREDRHDIGVTEAGEQSRFLEQLAEIDALAVWDLDGDLFVNPGVFRQIDRAEATAPDRREDLVFADFLTPEEHGCVGSIPCRHYFYNPPMHRFYAPDLDPSHSGVTLPADEAEHLTRVLRLGPGAIVAVFDGRGQEFSARVDATERNRVSLKILGPRQSAQESPLAITLAQAVLKSEKMDDVVRDVVMLGVTAIQPVVSSRAETTVAALQKARRTERWQRIAVASAKQCGRAVVPTVREPAGLSTFLTRSSEIAAEVKFALVEPSQPGGQQSFETLKDRARPTSALVLVGPEGGWTPREIERLSAEGFSLLTLGSRTFRAEAVPLAILALLQFMWGDL